MTVYETVIGLEVHAQLMTKTKIFCACSTAFGKSPNENTCPVCLGLPGPLPVLNRKAVEYAIKAGLATHCEVQHRSIWARKNYFYPDLPKGYQISQYEYPICLNGYLEFYVREEKKRVGIQRIHMEEDAGKLIHDNIHDEVSYVDLNRAGVPLIEIVSEPDIRSPMEAVAYLKHLRNILVYLEVCDGNMEEGSFRCDANISLRPLGEIKLGTRAELKNLNSFKFLEKALDYEIRRQQALLDDGKKVLQETRLYDVQKDITQSMRGKEDAHDYRYFPDPDLLPLLVDDAWITQIKKELPELAHEKTARFQEEYSLPLYDAEVLCAQKGLASHWEDAAKILAHKDISPKSISNLYMTHLLKLEKEIPLTFQKISPPIVAQVLTMENKGQLSGTMVKEILSLIAKTGNSVEQIIQEKGLKQVSDPDEIENIIAQVLKENPQEVEAYLKGKEKLFGFFVGQIMKALKGKGNPKIINETLRIKLNSLKN